MCKEKLINTIILIFIFINILSAESLSIFSCEKIIPLWNQELNGNIVDIKAHSDKINVLTQCADKYFSVYRFDWNGKGKEIFSHKFCEKVTGTLDGGLRMTLPSCFNLQVVDSIWLINAGGEEVINSWIFRESDEKIYGPFSYGFGSLSPTGNYILYTNLEPVFGGIVGIFDVDEILKTNGYPENLLDGKQNITAATWIDNLYFNERDVIAITTSKQIMLIEIPNKDTIWTMLIPEPGILVVTNNGAIAKNESFLVLQSYNWYNGSPLYLSLIHI